MDDAESWDTEYQNKFRPALRIVDMIERLSPTLPVHHHPLLGMLSFYWFERTKQARSVELINLEGWMIEHLRNRENHPDWFADLADCLRSDEARSNNVAR